MNKPYYLSHSIELSIPFHDVDSMQVVWHGNYFRYFENAREALLKKLAFGYSEMVLSDYHFYQSVSRDLFDLLYVGRSAYLRLPVFVQILHLSG